MHIAIWTVTALGLALWSLLCWGLAAVLGTDPAWVGELRPLVDRVPFGGLLDIWWPGWEAGARTLLDLTQSLLSWLGSRVGWLLWAAWAVGALLLLGLGGVVSLVVALVRKSTATPPQLATGSPPQSPTR